MNHSFKVGDAVRLVSGKLNPSGRIVIGKVIEIREHEAWPIVIYLNPSHDQLPVKANEIRHLCPGEKKKYEEYLSILALAGDMVG